MKRPATPLIATTEKSGIVQAPFQPAPKPALLVRIRAPFLSSYTVVTISLER